MCTLPLLHAILLTHPEQKLAGKVSLTIVYARLISNLTSAIIVTFVINGQELEIIPGMVAQVDNLSEPKTVLAYFIEPVLRVKDRAFRD